MLIFITESLNPCEIQEQTANLKSQSEFGMCTFKRSELILPTLINFLLINFVMFWS